MWEGSFSPPSFDWEKNMARYLVSLNTGVVLPYVPATMKSPGARELTAEEAATYEESVKKKTVAPIDVTPPAAEPKLVVSEPEPVVAEVVTQDFSEGEPDVEAVLGALEVD